LERGLTLGPGLGGSKKTVEKNGGKLGPATGGHSGWRGQRGFGVKGRKRKRVKEPKGLLKRNKKGGKGVGFLEKGSETNVGGKR